MLDSPEHSLGMRHHDGDPAVARRHTSNTGFGPIRVVGIAYGRLPPIIHIAQRHQLVLGESFCRGAAGKLNPALAVSNGNRHTGTGHAIHERRR